MDAASKPEGPEAFAHALESMRAAMKSYFQTHASREAETAALNEEAAEIQLFLDRVAQRTGRHRFELRVEADHAVRGRHCSRRTTPRRD